MYTRPLRSDELMHFGVKGMHWGVRRYQNKDGSLTSAGRMHYGMGEAVKMRKSNDTPSYRPETKVRSNPRNSDYLNQTIKTGKGRENQSPVEKISQQTDRAVNESARTVRNIGDTKRAIEKENQNSRLSKETSQMSDEELKRAIQRLDMERRYKDLNTQTKRNGYDVAADILEVAGGITSIAASAATVASVIYMIKRGSKSD